MKKEGILCLIVLLLLIIPIVEADLVTLIDFTHPLGDPRDVDAADGPKCLGIVRRPLLPWDTCLTTSKTKASTVQCSNVPEAATILEFQIDQPSSGINSVQRGLLTAFGGQNVVCMLNSHFLVPSITSSGDVQLLPSTVSCPSTPNQFLPSGCAMLSNTQCGTVGIGIFKPITIPGNLFQKDNTLFCYVKGSVVGFTLSYFSYEIDADFSEIACVGPNADPSRRARRWRQSLFDAGVAACCGDDADENGRIEIDPVTNKRSLLCYKDETAAPGDEFAWHDAAIDGGEAFIIKPLNDAVLGGLSGVHDLDIVSNKEEWFRCDSVFAGAGNRLPSPSGLRPSDKSRAAKFFCVNNLDHQKWLECCDPNALQGERACENALQLDRVVSPGGTSRSITHPKITLISELMERPGDLLRLDKNPDPQSYKLDITDWSTATSLGIGYTVSQSFDVIIKIYDDQGVLRFSDHLDRYVENSPGLGKPMFATVPAPSFGITKVNRVDFVFDPRGDPTLARSNLFTLNHAVLTPGVFYCSNARYSPGNLESNWIADLDDASAGASQGTIAGEPAGKSACDGYGYGWTGTQCCGNDGREFYGDSEAGCWNGEAVAESSTTMTIGYQTAGTNIFNCPFDSCSYPGSAGAINTQPLVYDVLAGKEKTVVSRVPQQFMFNASSFFGCLRSDTLLLNPTNIPRTGLQDAPLCSTKGGSTNFLCSPLDRGWIEVQSAAPLHVKTVIPGVNVLKNPRFDER